jgi:hypothetical protein
MTTIHFMLLDGPWDEVHPHIRVFGIVLGPVCGPILGKLCQYALGFVAGVFLRKYAALILWSATVLYLYAAWHNLFMSGFFD